MKLSQLKQQSRYWNEIKDSTKVPVSTVGRALLDALHPSKKDKRKKLAKKR